MRLIAWRDYRAWWFHGKLRLKARTVVRAGVWLRGAPVVAVTGTNGKTTTVQLIDRLLRAGGYRVGTCTTQGVYHNGQQVAVGDRAGHRGVWRALHCPGLQVLVAETARGGIRRYGTGFARCAVGVVTNLHADHLGFDGIDTLEQMAQVKAEIVRRTDPRGTVVLNADDPRVAAMATQARARVWHFSLAGREQEFANGWFLRAGWLWEKRDGLEQRWVAATELPLVYGGLRPFNLANALAALTAVGALRDRFAVSRETQIEVLRDYESDPAAAKGRVTLVRYQGGDVLLLHCKNPVSYELERPFVRQIQAALGCRYLVGVASAAGNRNRDYHQALSEQLAALCDAVFLRPPRPRYLRGISAEELLGRLAAALRPGQLLGTEPLAPADTLSRARERFGASVLLVYLAPEVDPMLDLDEFLREAEIRPLPANLGVSAPIVGPRE